MTFRHASVIPMAWLVLGWAAFAEDSPTLPRYRLTPGQEISNRSESRFFVGPGWETQYKVDWKIWLLDREPGGPHRLVIRCKMAKFGPIGEAFRDESVHTLVWTCRLSDDGRLAGATTMGVVCDPFRIFPRLPDGPKAMADGWESPGPEEDRWTIRYRMIPSPGPGQPATKIVGVGTVPEEKLEYLQHEMKAEFDPIHGFVARLETVDQQGYFPYGRVSGLIELISVEHHGAEWATRFGRDANAYFAGLAAYRARIAQAGRDPWRTEDLLARAKIDFEAARGGIAPAPLKDSLDNTLSQHDQLARKTAEEANLRAGLLGKPAAGWEAKDIDGKLHRLSDYRGRVVVMQFLHRGSRSGMRAMPEMNRLVEAFRGRPVTVLGMSTDGREEDARTLVAAMGPNYPTILAEPIGQRVEVRGDPGFLIVDRRGIVREVHIGDWPHLFDDLSALIRDLLAEKPR